MDGPDLLRSLSDKVGWQDLTQGMTTRDLMQTYGMSRGAAWRARTGRTRNPKFSQTANFRNRKAAEAFRRAAARTIRVGKVAVNYAGTRRPEGYRDIPAVDLEDPEEIASAIEDGDYEAAADALSAQIMAAYGAGDEDAVYLEIADWPADLFE